MWETLNWGYASTSPVPLSLSPTSQIPNAAPVTSELQFVPTQVSSPYASQVSLFWTYLLFTYGHSIQYGGGSEPEDMFLALLFPLSVLFLTALPEGSRSALSSTPLPFLSVGQTEEEPLLTACSGWKLGLVFCGQIKAFSRLPD